jgi:hypothetical protein
MYLKKSGCLADGYFSAACENCAVFSRIIWRCSMCGCKLRDCSTKVTTLRLCHKYRDTCAAVREDGE